MTPSEFLQYQNRDIRFKLKNGEELSGVLVAPMDQYENEKALTLYQFVPTNELMNWWQAKKEGDIKKMNALQTEIDITDILRAGI